MPTLVTMPKWGLTMKTGRVTEWLRPEGAEVAEGEPLLVVETEKAVNDVDAPAAGVLRRIVAPVGDEVPVSGPVAVIAAPDEALDDAALEALLAAARAQPAAAGQRASGTRVAREARAATRSEEGRVNASPAARKLARELGVDLSTVLATGPGGRITSEDVQRAADEADAAVHEDFVALPDGRRLFYVMAGRGEPALVFLHGLSGSQSTWQTVLAPLAEGHRVVALDLPGHGQSDKAASDAADHAVAGLARAVGQALDALGLGQVVLVGHSLGGAVALWLALERPERVARLVLVDSAGLGVEINPALLDRVEAAPGRDEVRALLKLFFHDPRHILESGVEESYRQRAAPGAQEALQRIAAASFSRAGQRVDLTPRLRELKVPTLILWGAEDRVIPAAHGRAAAAAIAGARVEVLDGVGHVPQVEVPERFARAVAQFVAAATG